MREGALLTARGWGKRRGTLWTGGSRLDNGKVGSGGAVGGDGWEGRIYYVGKNKEVYDAEVYAISRAWRTIDQREESGRRFIISSVSASVVDRARSDSLGPGLQLAAAIHEVGRRIAGRDNEITPSLGVCTFALRGRSWRSTRSWRVTWPP